MQNNAMDQQLPEKIARRLLHEDVADRLRDLIVQGIDPATGLSQYAPRCARPSRPSPPKAW